MKKKYLNQLIIFSYLLLLFFHFFVHRYYSIYPSLVFPSFSKAPQIEDNIYYSDISLYAITDRNNLKSINKEDFFSGYKKHVNYFLATIISNEKKICNNPSLQKARSAFLTASSRRLKKLYPKEVLKGLLIQENIKSYSAKRNTFNKDLTNGQLTVLYFKN